MKISRKFAHKLQNLIQAVMSYMELKQEERAKKKLGEMSRLIAKYTDENCDDCPRSREGEEDSGS